MNSGRLSRGFFFCDEIKRGFPPLELEIVGNRGGVINERNIIEYQRFQKH